MTVKPPNLTPLGQQYWRACELRSAGEGNAAAAMERAAMGEPHHTAAEFCCRGLAKLRHGDWSGWLDYTLRWRDISHQFTHARPYMFGAPLGTPFVELRPEWMRYQFTRDGLWAERANWSAELATLTILVGWEGGYGDGIMLARFLPWLAARAKRVYWVVPSDFHRLALTYGHAGVHVISKEPLPFYDQYVVMFSLPALVGALVPEERFPVYPRPEVTTGIRVAWAGNSAYGNNATRSLAAPDVARLADMLTGLDRHLWVMQRGDAGAQWPLATTDRSCDGDWLDTFGALRDASAVVTVDTGIAHLAGAMHLPTILMLSYDACWRWGLDGAATPWYPTMTILRQEKPGEWGPVIDRIPDTFARIAL